jgi:arylsulfatase A-like enzyme
MTILPLGLRCLISLVIALALQAVAQEPDRTILPIALPPFRGTVGTTYSTSTPAATPPIHAPAGAPNVLVILIDDSGYGQSGTFGGLIPTPTLDRLAAGGLRYTRFHVTALCSPSRAELMTGRHHHSVNMGTITNWSTDYPGYNASIPKSAAFVSEILRANGYATSAFGKWHLIPEREDTLTGPFDHWPTHQGFDHYYGFLNGETNQWHPELTLETQPVEMVPPPGRKADYTLNEDLADHAIEWIKSQKSLAPDRAPSSSTSPPAQPTLLSRPQNHGSINSKANSTWAGIATASSSSTARRNSASSHRTPNLPRARPPSPHGTLSLPTRKKSTPALMEVFAGFMAQTDHEMGRIIDAIADTGQLDNTLIIYIAGDNGASLEGGLYGTDNTMAQVNGLPINASDIVARLDELGGPTTTPHYPVGWAWAGNAPFQWGKRIASHLGGTRDPMVVFWPARIKDVGGIRTQFENITDVTPTILEAAGIPQPTSVNGVKQQPMNGVSML